jgi:ferredoxin
MLKVTFHDSTGATHEVETKAGKNLLDIAQENNVPMRSACGGNGTCTSCMVEVKDHKNHLSMLSQSEKEMCLPEDGTTRLGCQAKVIDDVTVEIVM